MTQSTTISLFILRASTQMWIGFGSRCTRVSGLTYAEYDSSNIPSLNIACIYSRTGALMTNGMGREFAVGGMSPSILNSYSNMLHLPGLLVKCCWYLIKISYSSFCCCGDNTGCPRRNVKYFGRVFLMLSYTDITQNTYVQS